MREETITILVGGVPVELESTSVIEAPGVTHFTFRVVK
jgi:hypothetical protein